jgi:hypothetical protein
MRARGWNNKRTVRFMVALLECILIMSLVVPGGVFAAADNHWGSGVKIKENAGPPWEMTQLVPDNDGGLFVVWVERRQFEQKMFAQKVGPDGSLLWGQPVQIIDAANMLYSYTPVVTSAGSLIVTWVDNRNKRKPDVYAQKIDANGNKAWGELGATVYVGPGAQDIRSIVPDDEGGAIIVWRDDERPGLYIQRLSGGGTRMWDRDGISLNDMLGIESQENVPYYGYDPTGEWVNVMPDGNGGLYLSWTDWSPYQFGYYEMPTPYPPAKDGHIFVQRVGKQGSKAWPSNISIDVKNLSDPWLNLLQVNENNEALITWSQPQGDPYIERKEGPDMMGYYPNPNVNLFATKITLDGEIVWSYSRPLLSRQGQPEYFEPGMSIAIGGGVLYSWTKVRFEDHTEKIFGPRGEVVDSYVGQYPVPVGLELTRIDETGKVAWKKTISSPKNWYQHVVSDKSGGFFLVVSSYVEGPFPFDNISVQRYDADGKALWGQNGVVLSGGPNTVNTGFVPDGKGGLYYGWRLVKQPPKQAEPSKFGYYGPYPSDEFTESDIYAQHIGDDGSGWSDIAIGDWPFAYVDGLAKMDAVQGYAEGDFKPAAHITRAEFAKMAVIALGIAPEDATATAKLKGTDVDGHWSMQYVAEATAAGVLKGYPNGTFKPDAKITRAEAATVIFRAKNLKTTAGAQSFSDVAISHWAFQGIDGARKLGIVEGYPDGTYRPANYTTRAEAAKMIFNVVNLQD